MITVRPLPTPEPNPGTTDTVEGGAELVGPYDGVYTVSFISNGIQGALGVLHIENSQFDGDLANIFNEVFTVTGYIDEYGAFFFEPIIGNFGSEVIAEGRIEDGLISGTYTIGDRPGFFTGSLRGLTFLSFIQSQSSTGPMRQLWFSKARRSATPSSQWMRVNSMLWL